MTINSGDMAAGTGDPNSNQMTVEDETRGSVAPGASTMEVLTNSEKKRVGKVYQKDAPLDQVIATEMARIRQAFDKRVVDHTEELVTKVQSGQPLV